MACLRRRSERKLKGAFVAPGVTLPFYLIDFIYPCHQQLTLTIDTGNNKYNNNGPSKRFSIFIF
jgi:hypothetical protein